MTDEIQDPAFSQKTDIEIQTEKYTEDIISSLMNPDWKITKIVAKRMPGIPYKVPFTITLEGPILDGVPQKRVIRLEGNAAPVPYEFNK